MASSDEIVVDERAILEDLTIVLSRLVIENFDEVAPILAFAFRFDDEVGAPQLSRDVVSRALSCCGIDFGRVDLFKTRSDLRVDLEPEIDLQFERVTIDDVQQLGFVCVWRLWVVARLGVLAYVVFDESGRYSEMLEVRLRTALSSDTGMRKLNLIWRDMRTSDRRDEKTKSEIQSRR